MNENVTRIGKNTDGSATLNRVEQLTTSFFSLISTSTALSTSPCSLCLLCELCVLLTKEKQDCERAAGKRWVTQHATHYAPLGGVLLGDDLYANQPFCQHTLDHDLHFLFVCKPDSHPTLYQWVETFAAAGKVETFSIRKWNGKHSELWTYRFLNQIPLRAGDDALLVNWCELHISHKDTGETLYHNAWVTDLAISQRNVAEIVDCGRARWKVENENNNVLKMKGYHLEHNFGHGDQYLAMMLSVTLSISTGGFDEYVAGEEYGRFSHHGRRAARNTKWWVVYSRSRD